VAGITGSKPVRRGMRGSKPARRGSGSLWRGGWSGRFRAGQAHTRQSHIRQSRPDHGHIIQSRPYHKPVMAHIRQLAHITQSRPDLLAEDLVLFGEEVGLADERARCSTASRGGQ
jgi:hypothetical protein